MTSRIRRLGLVAAAGLALGSGPASAEHLTDQWRRDPNVTMHELVEQGFEIKTMFVDSSSFLYDQTKFFMYVLQRGNEVFECAEGIRSELEDGRPRMRQSKVECYALVEPFAAPHPAPPAAEPEPPAPRF